MFVGCRFVSITMRVTRHQETNHLICSYEDTKKCRDANSSLRMALEFLPYETIVPIGVGTGASRQKGVYDLSIVFSVLGEEMIEVLEANLGAG